MYCDNKRMPRRAKVDEGVIKPEISVRYEESTPGPVPQRDLVKTFVISPRYTPI